MMAMLVWGILFLSVAAASPTRNVRQAELDNYDSNNYDVDLDRNVDSQDFYDYYNGVDEPQIEIGTLSPDEDSDPSHSAYIEEEEEEVIQKPEQRWTVEREDTEIPITPQLIPSGSGGSGTLMGPNAQGEEELRLTPIDILQISGDISGSGEMNSGTSGDSLSGKDSGSGGVLGSGGSGASGDVSVSGASGDLGSGVSGHSGSGIIMFSGGEEELLTFGIPPQEASGDFGESGFFGESGASGEFEVPVVFQDSGVSGVPEESGASGVPVISGESGASGVPEISGEFWASGVPDGSGESGVSGVPELSGIPEVSGASGVPEVSGTSGVPESSGAFEIIELSGEHWTSGVPEMSGESVLLEVSGETSTSGFPDVSGESSTSGVPEVSAASGVPEVSGTSGVPEVTAASGVPEVSEENSVLLEFSGESSTSGVPELSGEPGITVVPVEPEPSVAPEESGEIEAPEEPTETGEPEVTEITEIYFPELEEEEEILLTTPTTPQEGAGGEVGSGVPEIDPFLPGMSTCVLCICLVGSVYCDDLRLDRVPPLPKETTHFYARYNKIAKISKSDFANLNKLKKIDLTSNAISKIDDDAFFGLPALEEVIVRENNIRQIPALPPSMTLIDASHNQLGNTGIHREAFKDMPGLLYLYLTDNNIDHIPVPLPHSLRSLHLQNNNIQMIHDDTFCNPHDLNYIRYALEDVRLDGNPINLSRTPQAYICLPRIPVGNLI